MAYRGARKIISQRGSGGGVLTLHIVDGEADLPAASGGSVGDKAFCIAGGDDGKTFEIQRDSGGLAWVETTAGAAVAFDPATDNADDLGTSLLRFRDLWLGRRIATTGSIEARLSAAGITVLSVTNPSGTAADVWASGALRWSNSGLTSFYGALSGGPFSANRVFTFPDESGTVPLLERAGQTFAEVVTFAKGPLVGDAYYLRFAAPGGGELHLQVGPGSAGTALTLPAAGADTLVAAAFAQTLSAKTFERCRDSPLSVAAILALPSPAAGERAFASNGRKPGEGVGAGTGVPCFYDGGGWFSGCDGAALAA
ncbi:MAG: hypothetical protein U0324_46395 [Polyangiales bacterium]